MLTWKAIYEDGESLSQYNEDKTENFYKDIQRQKLVRFDLVNGEKTVHSLYLREGQRLIFRRRNFIRLSKDKEERHMIYLVGWQMTIITASGQLKNIAAINYIHEDGSIALDNSRDNLELLDFEK